MIRTVTSCLCLITMLVGCASAPMAIVSPPLTAATPLPSLLGSYHTVRKGETLWRLAHAYGLDVTQLAAANQLSASRHVHVGERVFIPLPVETHQFVWPVRGRARPGGGSQNLDIDAPSGSVVRASRSGRVAVATRSLSGFGKTVVIDHLDGYLSIYAHLEQILVSPDAPLRQGMPLGTLGGNPLYFEIRYGTAPKNPLSLLPSE